MFKIKQKKRQQKNTAGVFFFLFFRVDLILPYFSLGDKA